MEQDSKGMKSGLIYKDIGNVLLDRFPELQREFVSDDLKAEAPLAYPLFELFFKHFFFGLLDTNNDASLIGRVFSFLEEMANSPDRNVTDLLGIAILEPLVFQRERVRRAWKYMGEKTKKLARENAYSGGWQENLPPGEANPN
jgi:hypothetical protein